MRTAPLGAVVIWITTVPLSEAECGSLRLPAQREGGVLYQHGRGETQRLSSFENGRGDVGREVGQAENLAVVGSVKFFALGQIGKFARATSKQPVIEPLGFDNCLDQSCVQL